VKNDLLLYFEVMIRWGRGVHIGSCYDSITHALATGGGHYITINMHVIIDDSVNTFATSRQLCCQPITLSCQWLIFMFSTVLNHAGGGTKFNITSLIFFGKDMSEVILNTVQK
jgi:hypothetical protein